jgi:hypothetical protein
MKLISVRDAAQRLDLSDGMVRYLADKGDLQMIRVGSRGARAIYAQSVESLAAKRAKKANRK